MADIIEIVLLVLVVLGTVLTIMVRIVQRRFVETSADVLNAFNEWREENASSFELHVVGHCDKCDNTFEMRLTDDPKKHNNFPTQSRRALQTVMAKQARRSRALSLEQV